MASLALVVLAFLGQGCKRRVSENASIELDGSILATYVTHYGVRDLWEWSNLVRSNCPVPDDFTEEQGLGSEAQERLREWRVSAERERLASAGVDVREIGVDLDASRGLVVERVVVRHPSVESWQVERWIVTGVRDVVDESALTVRELSGGGREVEYKQRGVLGGGFSPAVLLLKAPQATPLAYELSITVPGEVAGASEDAKVSAKQASWLATLVGSAEYPYVRSVRFRVGVPYAATLVLGADIVAQQAERLSGVRRVNGRIVLPMRDLPPLSGEVWQESAERSEGKDGDASQLEGPGRAGRVVWRGKGLAGARLKFLHGSYPNIEMCSTAVTDSQGEFVVGGLHPGAYEVSVHTDLGSVLLSRVDVADGREVIITLGDRRLRVLVRDGSGGPVGSAQVLATQAGGLSVSARSASQSGEVLLGFLADGRCRLSAVKDFAVAELTIADVQGGEVSEATLTFRGCGRIDVQVAGDDGTPRPSVLRVRSMTGRKDLHQAFTDPSGRSSFLLPPGEWYIGLTSTSVTEDSLARFLRNARCVSVVDGSLESVPILRNNAR